MNAAICDRCGKPIDLSRSGWTMERAAELVKREYQPAEFAEYRPGETKFHHDDCERQA